MPADSFNPPAIEKVYWKDVRERVAKVAPEFAKIVDELDPGKYFPLYLAKYPYGCSIVKNGRFYLPSNLGKLVPINDNQISSQITNDLGHLGNAIPSGIVLKNSAELFIETKNRISPWTMFTPGNFFALWRTLEPEPSYHPASLFNITAGARTICMLPNIGDTSLHKNLRRDFGIRLPPPKSLLDHWLVFSSISQHPNAECDWNAELLFFPKKWFQNLNHDVSWAKLRLFLFEIAWKNTSYWRNKIFYDYVFSHTQANRNLKPNPYLADTVKHLLTIAIGASPGYMPARDNIAAPINLFQKVYTESYGLRKYVPTIFHPTHFMPNQTNINVYYSLQLPTALEFSPKSRKLSSTIHDLCELKHVTDIFLDEIRQGKLGIENTPVYEITKQICFEFFHSKPDQNGEIQSSKKLPSLDQALLACFDNSANIKFADTGSFVRGCVRISSGNFM